MTDGRTAALLSWRDWVRQARDSSVSPKAVALLAGIKASQAGATLADNPFDPDTEPELRDRFAAGWNRDLDRRLRRATRRGGRSHASMTHPSD